MSAIAVRGVEKSFDDVHVLRGVDLDVRRGSIVALLGSNGAGKTTLVRILATLLKPDAGAAEVNGFDVVAQGQRVRESISLTGQYAAVDELLSGRENSCSSPSCGTCPKPAPSPTGCSTGSRSPMPERGRSPLIPAACAVGSTSR